MILLRSGLCTTRWLKVTKERPISLQVVPKQHSYWPALPQRQVVLALEGKCIVQLISFQMLKGDTQCQFLGILNRFSGATPVGDIALNAADAQASSSTADGPALTGELDSEISQLLKSLSKKGTITKIKALQVNAHCPS